MESARLSKQRPMIVAHRIALDPNNVQAAYFRRASGVARFAYNWALDEWRRQYAARKDDSLLPAPSEVGLRKQLNSIKSAQFPWMFDVTKCATQEEIIRSAEHTSELQSLIRIQY